jgi:hypothetical protein
MYGQNIGRFLVNIFLWPTHFETKHFIIDVPKWHWAGRYAVDNKPVFFRVEEETCCTEDNALVIYFNDFINDITTEEWKQYCDKSIEKSTQKVANGEIDKYICKTSRDDIVTIGFFYKKEVFYSYICNVNDFQSQYEKFFEGVKLKQ